MSGGSTTIEDSLIYIGKWYGKMINSREITAKQYYTLLKAYERSNQKK
jgi:hypothetical protein